MKLAIIFATLFALSACGFKGDLYLPHDDDDATFSPIQTGVGLKPPVSDEPKGNENAE
ncbi:MAG: lipoprotein [Neisseriaceae bacterium]|nr:lipoprotein [Neisseriaceae bacterium]